MFILDASSSEGSVSFQKQLDFVSRVVNDFRIGPKSVQIGIITFSDNVNMEFHLDTYQSKSQILNAIQSIGYLKGTVLLKLLIEKKTCEYGFHDRSLARHLSEKIPDTQRYTKYRISQRCRSSEIAYRKNL